MKNLNEGLGLTETEVNEVHKTVVRIQETNHFSYLSDYILAIGETIKVEELGVQPKLSKYEVKTLLAGYYLGLGQGEQTIYNKFLDNPEEAFRFMSHLGTLKKIRDAQQAQRRPDLDKDPALD